MIIKGGPRSKGRELAAHLTRVDTNEEVRVLGFQGVAARDVKGALAEMEAVAAGGKTAKPLYHVSISPKADEHLTDEQWQETADRLAAALGMEGHQRLIVLHTKAGASGELRQHAHVVFNRVDVDTLKTAHHSHNYRTHEEVARALEREFGLDRTQGVHAERDGEKKKRRERSNTQESQQEARTGWPRAKAKEFIGQAWAGSENGAALMRFLQAGGYCLAQGDTRDFVVIDPAGGVHSIRSGVRGLLKKQIDERLADIDRDALPLVAKASAAARAAYAERQKDKVQEKEKAQSAKSLRQSSVRPPTAQPHRYAGLTYNMKTEARSPVTPTTVKAAAPQLVPKPPSWALEAKAMTTPAARVPAPKRPDRPPLPSAENAQISAELAQVQAHQAHQWRTTAAEIEKRHKAEKAKLETYHAKRMGELVVDIDERLKQLNGLGSRAGALFDRSERDREIAYLVAKRQRSLAEEKARQDRAKEDLRRAQVREMDEAKGKHDRLTTLRQRTVEERKKQKPGHMRKSQRGRDGLEPE